MSNNAGSGENDPLPYIPAWTENTLPHGHPLPSREATLPHVPVVVRRAQADGRAARRAAAAPSGPNRRGRGVLVAVVAVLLVGGTAAGGWWYVHKENGGPQIHEGDCLRDKAPVDQKPVRCDDPEARFIVVERVQGTTFSGICDSVPGDPIALTSDPTVESFVLCLAARK
ncbi:hypothetical protein [Embleya sp. NPDC005575]|uniref:LppU/SCO3897 family protein n=1 Tax=Embleya sp. NPDC005575 TaxID=3156892 RepID=UPI0033B759C8